MLFLYIHWVTCFWWVAVEDEQVWIPPTDFMYGGTNIFEASITEKYLKTAYHVVLTFYLVEICPRNAREVLTCVVIYLINAIVNANIFGQFLDLMTEINKESDEMANVF